MDTARRQSGVDGRKCPQCRHKTLVFNARYPVLTATNALTRTGTGPHDGSDRLHYESAWVCQNPRCNYREIVGSQ
jgi:hypothetical protein